jgi:dihydroorotate dehydrogenase
MNVSYADRQGFENAADDKNEVMTRDKSAGFVYSVDNSADVPVVNISSVVLPRGEAVVKASFEIHLCKTSADVSKMQTLAVMNVPAEVGSYDFSQYAQNIAKQDIDGVRIVLNISTDKHPAPNENTDAYMISGYSGVFGE